MAQLVCWQPANTRDLRSASNAFKDLSGNLLDGNSGVGTNYSATFSVAAPQTVLAIPSFAHGPAGATFMVPINTGTGIPITMMNART